jgi:nicotinamidase-related amidase
MTMLMKADDSTLLVVDMQGKLLTLVDDWQRILDNVMWLTRVAQKIGVPVMATEQYPQGLGQTQPDLLALFPSGSVAEKNHFSCVAANCLHGLPGAERRQVVVCGIESHVCVMQTALDLRWAGKDVFVVADAVSSRNPDDKHFALERMRHHGIEIVTREMACFEWLHQAGTDLFRDISRNFLR